MTDGESGGCRMLLRCDFRITCPQEVENCGQRHGQSRIQEGGQLHMSTTSSVICYICMTWPLFTSRRSEAVNAGGEGKAAPRHRMQRSARTWGYEIPTFLFSATMKKHGGLKGRISH